MAIQKMLALIREGMTVSIAKGEHSPADVKRLIDAARQRGNLTMRVRLGDRAERHLRLRRDVSQQPTEKRKLVILWDATDDVGSVRSAMERLSRSGVCFELQVKNADAISAAELIEIGKSVTGTVIFQF